MAGTSGTTRVGILTPMEPELAPIVRMLSLEAADDTYRGRTGDVDVVAVRTDIGMENASAAARRVVDLGAEHVMVVGIAGGVDPAIAIGDAFVPEVVVSRSDGCTYRPWFAGDLTPRGTLSCGDDLIVDPEVLAAMGADGVVAVDMETAAVAAVCEQAGRPWSVFRAVSDRPAEGLVDAALFAMTRPDGTADRDALSRYLDEDPGRIDALTRLAHDASLATEAAAAAATRACRML
jgi:adenosylhomocysteine nucleosidase